MRLSNRNRAPAFNFINSLLLMTFLGGLIAFFLERYKFRVLGWESIFFILLPFLLLVIFYYRGRQIFEYDSDGEALNFKNRSVIPFFEKAANDEFPKYKLLKYEIINALIFKKLYISISSKKNNYLTLKYDISYLSKKEISDLKFSLSKVLKNNREKIATTTNKQ